ncbi:MAG: protoheme IX farnesyltransferase [Lewinellaceae bacterium]|nr:protoheme IX farnesyltransferase [Lewinellaceae bacterium]
MNHNQVKESVLRDQSVSNALTDFVLLVKFKLTLLVIFPAVMSYAIVAGTGSNLLILLELGLGGFLVTGSANALNQVLERETDLLMPRTMNRPVAAGRMSISQAVLIAGIMALGGIILLTVLHPLAGFLGTLSLISYAFIYTPMKKNSVMAVVIGAIPGALPLIIGPVVFEGYISATALMLFSIQFFWQFPHFWAVAWLADDDYKRAGFKMLPTADGAKTPMVGLLSLAFCMLLIGNSAMAWALGTVGLVATVLLVIINLYFAYTAWRLYRECSREAARRQMFASFFHLPLSLMVLLADKLF